MMKGGLPASAAAPLAMATPASQTDAAFEPLYVPFKRAVEISGLGKSTLYRAAMDGRLRLVKNGRTTLAEYASLRALLASLPAAQLRNAA